MFRSLFKPVPKWTMETAKQYFQTHRLDAYNLIDVRQPEEYTTEHIPGAKLIPLGELPQRMDEIDKNKPTLVYCRSGARAGNATALLIQAGFGQANNIGGILDWKGLVASGAPEAGMLVFDAARKPQEYVALAWVMEEGARAFYQELGGQFSQVKEMFDGFAADEAHHRDLLAQLYQDLGGRDMQAAAKGVEQLMEGGINRNQALEWSRTHKIADVLEFAATMEANAHDRYIQVGRALCGATERAFITLAEAEKKHLDQLLQAYTQHLS
jgi:sulfur-carrier protein adenylyltransferase/sulfurtransferase